MTTTYKVTTRDTDGGTSRTYKTIAKAVARFEEMAGVTLAAAREEMTGKTDAIAPTAVKYVRAVSMFGTVVMFDRNGPEEVAPVEPTPPAVEPLSLDAYEEALDALLEARRAARESYNDVWAQHRSETALFGDSWPGAQVQLAEQRAAIDELDRQYENLLASPPRSYKEMIAAREQHEHDMEHKRFEASYSDEVPF